MKYEMKIMRAGELIFEAVLDGENQYGNNVNGISDEAQDAAAFAIEKAINQQTDLRCHVHRQ